MWIKAADNTAMSCLKKNGSTSIINCIGSKDILTNSEALHIKKRIFWIRNPIDRLVSCYSFFHHLNKKTDNCIRDLEKHETASWNAFIDAILSRDNPHWSPQAEQLKIDGNPVWTKIHKFEDIIQKWGDYLPGLLPWYNACTHENITDYRSNEILALYDEDIQIWRSL